MAKGIGAWTKSFNEYIKKYDTTQLQKKISVNELKDVFFSLKISTSAGYEDICFGVLLTSLAHI